MEIKIFAGNEPADCSFAGSNVPSDLVQIPKRRSSVEIERTGCLVEMFGQGCDLLEDLVVD